MCVFLINAAISVGAVPWLWMWWLPSQDITSLLYLHVSKVFHGVLFFDEVANWGIPKVHSLLGRWVHQFPLLGPLFIYLAWINVVFMFSILGLSPRVRSGLVHGWAFAHRQTRPISFMLCLGPSLVQFINERIIILVNSLLLCLVILYFCLGENTMVVARGSPISVSTTPKRT